MSTSAGRATADSYQSRLLEAAPELAVSFQNAVTVSEMCRSVRSSSPPGLSPAAVL